jgi:peptidoglycan hydrolase CwlO-like protein
MKLLLTTAAVLLSSTIPVFAQSTDSAGNPPSPAKPADTSPNATAAPSTEKKKPKKVWTDDNIGSVKGDVSVVGDGHTSNAKSPDKQPSANGADDARQKQIESYRDQIQQYQAQIASIDKRIDQLKNFKAENTSPSGGINPNQGYNMVPVEEQVKQLEDKKKQLQAKIDDVEVEAKRNGIDAGDLR